MTKAKTASKNIPTNRGKARVYMYNDKKVKPIKLMMEHKTYIAGEYESGDLVMDSNNNVLDWSVIAVHNKIL